jgi:hypothetical protein
VTVRVLDAYKNLVTSDSTDQVTVAIGTNPAGGTLSGTLTVTVSGGVATFGDLSINNAGTGYTLTATSGSLTGATSSAFNVSAGGNVIEGFETSSSWFVTGFGNVNAFRSTAAAHDGTYGLDMFSGSDWIYRTDAAVQARAGDTLSVWVQFAGSANGRAYFGFGASSGGTLSLVAAPNTGQLIIQQNLGFGFQNLAAVGQGYRANHWYRLEVDWGTSGRIVGKLFDSNGTTLLRSVTASTTAITSGGIAFRAIGNSDKYFDTVTATYGVNHFSLEAPTPSTPMASLPGADEALGPPALAGSSFRDGGPHAGTVTASNGVVSFVLGGDTLPASTGSLHRQSADASPLAGGEVTIGAPFDGSPFGVELVGRGASDGGGSLWRTATGTEAAHAAPGSDPVSPAANVVVPPKASSGQSALDDYFASASDGEESASGVWAGLLGDFDELA